MKMRLSARGNKTAFQGLRLLHLFRSQSIGSKRTNTPLRNNPFSPSRTTFGNIQAGFRPSNFRVMASSASVDPEPFKLALCQLQVTADKEENITSATKAVKEAASNGANIIVLPEMWNCPYSNDSFPTYAEEIDSDDSPSANALSSKFFLLTFLRRGSASETDISHAFPLFPNAAFRSGKGALRVCHWRLDSREAKG
mmetsp:Transcript_13847/g.26602  ORF Transcript_13847/g.26602 Transcript_13847/m.26602 type:complete len:197 (+) Transcript_13847:45-635(+)